MPKNPRTNVLTETTEAAIKRLGKLLQKEAEITEELTRVHEKKDELIVAIGQTLDEGKYRVGNWLCEVTDKFAKGKASPSWKSIAETTKTQIDLVRDEMIRRFPDAEVPLQKNASVLHKKYNEAVEVNTKIGEDKTSTVVTVEQLTDADN